MADSASAPPGNAENANTPAGDKNAPTIEKPPEVFKSKIFRLLTVGVYLAGVSGLGMTISFYLLFFWDSRMPTIPVVINQVG